MLKRLFALAVLLSVLGLALLSGPDRTAAGPVDATPTTKPTAPPTPTSTKGTPPPTPTKDAPPTPPPHLPWRAVPGTVTMTKEPAPPTPTPDCVPLTGIELSGPKVCFVGLGCRIEAVPVPGNATTPTYTWSTDGLVDGQGTTSVRYSWSTTGPETIGVAAANCPTGVPPEYGGTASASRVVVVEAPAANLYLPVVLRE